MRVLVTGATGRIGRRFVPRLLQHVSAVRILARDAERADPLRERGAEVVLGDLREADTLGAAVSDVTAVVHPAGPLARTTSRRPRCPTRGARPPRRRRCASWTASTCGWSGSPSCTARATRTW